MRPLGEEELGKIDACVDEGAIIRDALVDDSGVVGSIDVNVGTISNRAIEEENIAGSENITGMLLGGIATMTVDEG